MSNIKISQMPPAGSDLFSDSESFMSELTNDELDLISGGAFTSTIHNVNFTSTTHYPIRMEPTSTVRTTLKLD